MHRTFTFAAETSLQSCDQVQQDRRLQAPEALGDAELLFLLLRPPVLIRAEQQSRVKAALRWPRLRHPYFLPQRARDSACNPCTLRARARTLALTPAPSRSPKLQDPTSDN